MQKMIIPEVITDIWVALVKLWLKFNKFQPKVGFKPGTLTVLTSNYHSAMPLRNKL